MLVFGRPHDDSKGQSGTVDTEEARRFDRALFSTLDALESRKIHYALIGGVAASSLGRPRPTQDIDLFVRPEDAEGVLEVFKEFGFETNRFNPSWIYKAYVENVLIDIIFRSEGGFYFDQEMHDHTALVQYHGRPIRVVSPEDFILIKSAAHSEEGHHHWHDALAVLGQSKVDWNYLIHRSRKAPRRLLALLIYAQSTDIFVPNHTIQQLYETVFENGNQKRSTEFRPTSRPTPKPQVKTDAGDSYLAAKVREALVESGKTGALDIEVYIQNNRVLARGQIQSEEQHQAILDIIHETAPSLRIEDQLHVAEWQAPRDVETLQ